LTSAREPAWSCLQTHHVIETTAVFKDNGRRSPRRRQTRLSSFDYSSPGFYFVTICIQDKKPILGSVEGDRVVPSDAGSMVQRQWQRIPRRFPHVDLDEFVIMPDHLHGILELTSAADASATSPHESLSDVMSWFKVVASVEYARNVKRRGWPAVRRRLWLRGFHDRVVRDDDELAALRLYIRDNPRKWRR